MGGLQKIGRRGAVQHTLGQFRLGSVNVSGFHDVPFGISIGVVKQAQLEEFLPL
jgi:hypothetical protein